jgi:aminoglycoside/choline kinase family phosphotransferase
MRVEASTRTFLRVTFAGAGGRHTEVAMASPPATEKNDRFVAMQRVFERAGLPVARIVAMDERNGFFLLTDLGTRDLEQAYAEGGTDAALTVAIDHLLRLQRIEDPALTCYPPDRFVAELGIFTDWFVERLLHARVPAAMEAVFETLVANDLAQPQCCIHLDWHCRNLLLSNDGGFGIVDIQDAMIGPATYDLASLLYDCYHEFDRATIRRWQQYYLERTSIAFEPAEFERVFDLTALQRQLKAIGIFARLFLRDGKATHLRHIRPVLAVARTTAARYGATRPLAEWAAQLDDVAADVLP